MSYKFKPEIKELLAAALESGEYDQCPNELHNEVKDAYCCLGVLAKLYIKQLPENTIENDIYDYALDGDQEIPNDEICSWALEDFVPGKSLPCDAWTFKLPDKDFREVYASQIKEDADKGIETPPGPEEWTTSLTELNDDGIDFKTIAKVIRRHF